MDLSKLNLSDMGNTSTAYILWVLLFSSIGVGFFIYGRKQAKLSVLIAGILLMIYPMFISNTYLLVLIGAGLVMVPFFI